MKFIQIAATECMDQVSDAMGTLYALADDGSVWMMISPWQRDAEWKKLPEPKNDS
jgi:hypothetical protein